MFELIDIHPDVNVLEAEYVRLLGYPRNHVLEGRPQVLAQWAREWYQQNGKPWVYARKLRTLEADRDRLRLEGIPFVSNRLCDQLVDAGADGAFVAAVSAGKECEEMAHRLWLEDKPDEYFFLETYGSAVVEYLIANTGFRFCEWADLQNSAVLPHYSPGYPGWDISDQEHLFNLIVDKRTNVFPAELRVLDTGMLNPKKSLLAVFGITSKLERVQRLTSLIPCQNCSLPSCQYRRTPYKQAPPRIESVGRPNNVENSLSLGVENTFPLNPKAQYTISPTALRKWSRDRLRLNLLESGHIDAEFHYEGTTCSNLGHPLEFVYRIRLGSAESGFRIEQVECMPSANDEGYKYMCEFLDKGDAFIQSIINERPLVGKQLEDAISWEREFNPSGCFCDSASRQHKWGLVFEVLHYALANIGNGTSTLFSQSKQ